MIRPCASILLFATLLTAVPAAVPAAPLPAPPAGPGAMAPQLAAGGNRVYLSWVEPRGAKAHALRVAAWRGGAWSPVVDVAVADDMLVNWADVPAVAVGPDGTLRGHWLRRVHGGYVVELVRSSDGGATWSADGPLATDAGPSEHGFVSYAPVAGVLHAFWMDGRGGSGMTLWDAALGAPAAQRREAALDDRVCDCCATAAAVTAAGPVVVYRDRSAAEVRDIGVVRYSGGVWSAPALVHEDGWKIRGCPVNGPSVAASGTTVAVVWYTAAGDRPRVQLARSEDGGAHFAAPVAIDDAAPFGRVGVALGPDGAAWASWVGRRAEGGELRVRRVDAQGVASAPLVVASIAAGRTNGVPRLMATPSGLLVAWTDGAGPSSTIRVESLPFTAAAGASAGSAAKVGASRR